MTSLGGGEIAAYGLSYQYLVTLDYVLRYLRTNPALIQHATLVVEPLIPKPDGKTDDIVDFAIEVDGESADQVQVKSSAEPAEHPLQPTPARAALERLLGRQAANSLILTNKPLSPQLLGEAEAMSTQGRQVTYTWANGPQPPAGDQTGKPRIIVDARSPAEVRDSIAELVRHFRRYQSFTQGLTSSRLLVPILLDHIFQAAAGNEPNRISALDLLGKIAMPDARIAHVAGGFDWGLPMSNIPNYLSTVPRMSYLDQVQEHIPTDDTATTPAYVVLTGQTGIGKSVIASDYCHVDSISYEFMCWIDCRDVGFIEPQVRNIVSQLTTGAIAPSEGVGPVFAGLLGRRPGPWLIVFDGIQNRADIDQYVPSRGHGSVLVTTNNSLNWWPTARVIEVGQFGEQEAIDCFCSYAAIPAESASDLRDVISGIVERIGWIPLAVSMSAIYFKNTEGQLSELVTQYFSDLTALADTLSIPPGFHHDTAFTAIQYAVTNLGIGTPAADLYGRRARAVLEIGSLLAPELLPLNFILPATADSVTTNLANLPAPAEVDPVLRRGVLSILRTQTIARRVINDGQGNATPASETVAFHPLVHDILQESYLAAVPPGQLQAQSVTLMGFLLGWLGPMRDSGEYFAVEQLRLHAQALLKLLNAREPLSSFNPGCAKVYTYAKALLQSELSTCQASRGNLQAAYDLAWAAMQNLSSYAHERAARLITMKVLVKMIKDLSMAEVPPALIGSFSTAMLPAIRAAENDEDDGVRGMAYEAAGDLYLTLNRIEAYRNSPLLQGIAAQLQQISARDPAPDTREASRMIRLNQLYEAGQFHQIRELLPQWRAADDSLENALILDAIEIAAQLHTDAIDEALQGVDHLLATKTYANYLFLSLFEALKKVARELYRVAADREKDRQRIQDALEKVLWRYNELGGSAEATNS